MTTDRNKYEILAPAGNMQKLKTALYFGADAVYAAGKRFGLRAYADNFSDLELKEAADLVHSLGKKLYVTVNIYPDSSELDGIAKYAEYLESINADGAIISDLGVFSRVKKAAPRLDLHVSTQANVTNSAAAAVWAELGAKRIVLARELTLQQIAGIREALPEDVELEAFVHGAMCIAYSGRCLLSSYFASRGGNKGECVQCCRWEYDIVERSRGEALPVLEDGRGTYILSSRDLCMIEYMDELINAGVTSFKIEGRVKSEYYAAGAVAAYKRALERALDKLPPDPSLSDDLKKISHRGYTTGFYLGGDGGGSDENKLTATHSFIAVVVRGTEGGAEIEMRNRFETGDTLEVLSPGVSHNSQIVITGMEAADGSGAVTVADKVKQRLLIKTDVPLQTYDILRRKI